MTLHRVTDLAERIRTEPNPLRAELHTAIREAHKAGVPAIQLARTVGVSRQRIYQILEEK